MYLEIQDHPDHLCQGDIFTSFESEALQPIKPKEAAFIVLTYTCDLKNPKDLDYITYSPIFTLDQILEDIINQYKIKYSNNKPPKNLLDSIIQRILKLSSNTKRFLFFLSPLPRFNNQIAFANINQIYSIQKKYSIQILTNRIACIRSPWKEKLGSMVGYLYNRVALEDIKKESIVRSIEKMPFVKNFIDEIYEKK